MKLRHLLATTLLASAAAPVMAQTTPAFRVPLEHVTPSKDLDSAFSWIETVGSCSTSCGSGVRTKSYQCQDVTNFDFASGGFGSPEPASQCVAAIGAKPSDQTDVCSVYSGCSFDWVKPEEKVTIHPVDDNPVGRPGCGKVQREFDPHCERSDETVLAKGDHAFCAADLPDYNDVAAGKEGALGYDRTAIETDACNPSDHLWVTGNWGPSSSTCSSKAFKTRSVSCEREFDGTSQPDSACSQPKPAMQKSEADYSSCSYTKVNPTAWESADTCSSSTTQTRAFDCRRSNDGGEIVADSACTSRGISLTETRQRADYSSCSYEAKFGSWSAWSSNCSSTARRTRSADCLRSDGTIVDDSQCTSRRISLTPTSETEARYGSCSYSADFGGWSAWSSDCSSTATRTRSVQCLRSDGTVVSDSSCTSRGISLSPVSETSARYGSCSYSRVNPGPWSAWANACSSSTSRTRTYQCRRSNGDIVASSECTSRGIGLSETDTGANYAGCSYGWVTGSWGGYSSTCSSTATRLRSVQCRRSDGAIVTDSSCSPATRPAASETSAQYGGCSYAAYNWSGYGAWSSTCSANATRTRTADCRRSDGTIVADSNCTTRGIALSQTQSQAVYSGCSYAAANWTPYSPWSSTCSASASRNRTADCRRSDGTIVADSNCTTRGISLSQTQTQAVYSGCSYSWNAGGWSAWSSTCSSSAARTRSVTCRRSNGTTVADSYCKTTKPATNEVAGQYGGCSYAAYNWSAYGSWSSTCSASATRTRTADCRRSDGTIVADSNCTTRGISLSQTQTGAVYSGCGYAAYNWSAYGAWSSTCSANATRTRTADCRRTDGKVVADSECTSRGISLSQTQTNGVYSGCGYAAYNWSAYGSWSSTCSANATRTRTADCRRSDGTIVADSNCTTRGIALSQSQTSAVYSGCGYSWVAGSWSGWSSTCSSNATRTRSVSCRRSDGTIVADSQCPASSRPSSSDSSAQYGGCSYDANYGAWSACTSGTRTRSVTCTRSDGATVAASYCGTTATESETCVNPSCYSGTKFRFRFGSGPEFSRDTSSGSVYWSNNNACISQWVGSPGELYARVTVTNNGVTKTIRASRYLSSSIVHGQRYTGSATANVGGQNYTVSFEYSSQDDYFCEAQVRLSPNVTDQC